QRLLRAVEDDDAIGAAADAAELREVARHGAAQLREAARIGEVERVTIELARCARLQAMPQFPGELARVGDAGVERTRRSRLAAGGVGGNRASAARRRRRSHFLARYWLAESRHGSRDESDAPFRALEK